MNIFRTYDSTRMGVILILAGFSQLSNARIDCDSAGAAVEIAICGDKKLTDFEGQLDFLNEKLHALDPNALADHATWVKDIRNRCDYSNCLVDEFTKRITSLRAKLSSEVDEAPVAASTVQVTNPSAVSDVESRPSETFEKVPAASVNVSENRGSKLDNQGQLDCIAPRSATESAVCASAKLRDADEEMRSLYVAQVQKGMSLQGAQERWLQDVRDKCLDNDCLMGAYRRRIFDLNRLAGVPTSSVLNVSSTIGADETAEGMIGVICRPYQHAVIDNDGRQSEEQGTTCRDTNGDWHTINSTDTHNIAASDGRGDQTLSPASDDAATATVHAPSEKGDSGLLAWLFIGAGIFVMAKSRKAR